MAGLVFFHLPKTAGTSFHAALCNGFGASNVTEGFVASHITSEQASRMSRFEVISGHISLADVLRYFGDARTVTILRDPIDRCLSWYYFARKIPVADQADVAAAHELDADEFFSLDPQVTFRNIFNRQVRQLGDHVLNPDVDMNVALDRAKRAIDACAWFGRQEYLARDLAGLPSVFPEMADVGVENLNVTPDRASIRDISSDLTRKILKYNRYDVEFYNYACSLRPKRILEKIATRWDEGHRRRPAFATLFRNGGARS